jgi:hypothetical protein
MGDITLSMREMELSEANVLHCACVWSVHGAARAKIGGNVVQHDAAR